MVVKRSKFRILFGLLDNIKFDEKIERALNILIVVAKEQNQFKLFLRM
jgi:hypothetical protein